LLAGADELARWAPGIADGRVFLIGGGAHSAAYRQIVADLIGRPVTVPHTEELVACGAAAQAAVVLTGRSFEDVASAWQLGAGTIVEPRSSADGARVRDAYAAAAR
ncbi:MAG: xylulokinase, partial [Actinomycetota bacterium]